MREVLLMFATVFLAESGDKTQLATVLFASENKMSPWAVFAASGGALAVRRFRTPDELTDFHRIARAISARTYQERLQHEPGSADARRERCRRHNPRFILRNHLAQAAIERAERGDFSEVDRLMRVLSAPYDDQPGEDDYARVPPPWARHIEVSCSS